MTLSNYSTCVRNCSTQEAACLSSNDEIANKSALCASQNAVCLNTCAETQQVHEKNALSGAGIAWIVVLSFIGLIIVMYVLWYLSRRRVLSRFESAVRRTGNSLKKRASSRRSKN